jgi:hypothetical protein
VTVPALLFLCIHHAGQGVDAVRPTRDEIERRVRELLESLGVSPG